MLEKTLTHLCVMFEVTTNNFNAKQKSADLVAGFCAAISHGKQPQACGIHSIIS